ncbi:MAG: rhodanese-like domain-containing protein [Nanoarchaeota archaeon]
METNIKTITLKGLRKLLQSDEDFVLVNPLNRENFEEGYIPKSIHISVHADDFKEKVKKIIPNKNRKIIVYCKHDKCETSDEAYEKLIKIGYTNVYKYAGGTKEWSGAGYPLVSIK